MTLFLIFNISTVKYNGFIEKAIKSDQKNSQPTYKTKISSHKLYSDRIYTRKKKEGFTLYSFITEFNSK